MESRHPAIPDTGIEADPLLQELVHKENIRQKEGIQLIASENYTSKGVMQLLGSALQNKYAEGYPGARYYPGNEFVDQIEKLAQSRALEAFHLDPTQWFVNVQPLSGCPANFAVYTALIGKEGRILGLNLQDGGHLSHGFKSPEKCISATSLFFESRAYHLNSETGHIDYDEMEQIAEEFRPEIIIAGYSAHSYDLDYKRF